MPTTTDQFLSAQHYLEQEAGKWAARCLEGNPRGGQHGCHGPLQATQLALAALAVVVEYRSEGLVIERLKRMDAVARPGEAGQDPV